MDLDTLDSPESSLQADTQAKDYIITCGRWARAIAITGFVIAAIYFCAYLFLISQVPSSRDDFSVATTFYFVIIVGLMITSSVLLLVFANNAISAVKWNSQSQLHKALRFLKAWFILTAILYMLALLFLIYLIYAIAQLIQSMNSMFDAPF